MEIVRCKENDPVAQDVFRLRYEVFAKELSLRHENIDSEAGMFRDQFDKIARIYAGRDGGTVISSIRYVIYADLTPEFNLQPEYRELLSLDMFLPAYGDHMSIASRFVVRPDRRGSISTMRLMNESYLDGLRENIKFVFAYCSPYLIDMYTQLGFQIHGPPMSFPQSHFTPMVLVMRDFGHLERIKSPLYRAAVKAGMTGGVDDSVAWFYKTFASEITSRPSVYDQSQLSALIQYYFSAAGDKDESPRFLDSLDEAQCNLLLSFCKLVKCKAGEKVIGLGQKSREMFIIMSGQVAVRFAGGDRCIRLGPGQVIGEIALLLNTARTADCTAEDESDIAILSHQALEQLLKAQPDLGNRLLLNLAKTLSYRLALTNNYSALNGKAP